MHLLEQEPGDDERRRRDLEREIRTRFRERKRAAPGATREQSGHECARLARRSVESGELLIEHDRERDPVHKGARTAVALRGIRLETAPQDARDARRRMLAEELLLDRGESVDVARP